MSQQNYLGWKAAKTTARAYPPPPQRNKTDAEFSWNTICVIPGKNVLNTPYLKNHEIYMFVKPCHASSTAAHYYLTELSLYYVIAISLLL